MTMNTDPMYNEYVMGDEDYHEDMSLREWEYYALYTEEDIDEDDD
jgi:hypothetical protein